MFFLCHFLALSFLARSLFVLCSFLMCLTAVLPQISQIYADEPQNSINLKQPVFLCEIMQPCCIPLCVICVICGRITRKLTQSIYTNETPISPADHADLRRQTTKQQNSLYLKLTVFLCVIMQPAAFLCVICAICGRIYIQTYSINIHRRNPNISPADHADLRRQTPKQH